MPTNLRTGIITLLLASCALAQNVIVLTPGPNQTATLQSAIDAAADGDIIVLAGAWSAAVNGASVLVDGKGLTLVAAEGSAPGLRQLRLRNLPAGGRIVLRGLRLDQPEPVIESSSSAYAGRVTAQDCAGAIWIEDCTLMGEHGMGTGFFGLNSEGQAGLFVDHCAAVNVERCELRGGHGTDAGGVGMGAWNATEGGAGLRAVESSCAVRSSTLTGDHAGEGGVALWAGAGAELAGGQLLLTGCEVQGGDDLDTGTNPAAGLLIVGSGAVARRATSIAAGAGFPQMPDISAPPGNVVKEYPAPPRTVELDSPLHEQQAGTLHLAGAPGDQLFLFAGFQGGALPISGKQGTLSIALPLLGPFVVGAIGPAGVLDVPFTTPDLVNPAALGSVTLLQLAAKSGSKVLLEGTTAFIQLDASVP